MSTQRLFIILSSAFLISSIGWYFLIYQPIRVKTGQTEQEVHKMSLNLTKARRAEKDLQHLEIRLKNAQTELEKIKQRFINRKKMVRVTNELQKKAEEYDLIINDFSPILDSYFESSRNHKIKPLPIVINLTGRYLQIGKFLESLDQLDFYLIPNEFTIEKLDPESDDLTATIFCILYTWNS